MAKADNSAGYWFGEAIGYAKHASRSHDAVLGRAHHSCAHGRAITPLSAVLHRAVIGVQRTARPTSTWAPTGISVMSKSSCFRDGTSHCD